VRTRISEIRSSERANAARRNKQWTAVKYVVGKEARQPEYFVMAPSRIKRRLCDDIGRGFRVEVVSEAAAPQKLVPALAQFTSKPFNEPPLAMAPVLTYTCEAGFSIERPNETVGPKSFTALICQLRV
jgi:hypothetical protein